MLNEGLVQYKAQSYSCFIHVDVRSAYFFVGMGNMLCKQILKKTCDCLSWRRDVCLTFPASPDTKRRVESR